MTNVTETEPLALTIEPWIQTYRDIKFNILEPEPDQIAIGDIAHALAMQCRFTGHTRIFYSVAEHCINAAKLVPEELAFEALMHDASEAYLTDIATPVKQLLPDYQKLEKTIEYAIRAKFGLPKEMSREVKEADKACLTTEARNLMIVGPDHWVNNPRYSSEYYLQNHHIIGLDPRHAELEFLRVFTELCKLRYKKAKTKNVPWATPVA